MSLFRCHVMVALATLLAITPVAQAQQPTPNIGYVYPAGGQQGTTFQVTIGGQRLDGITQAFLSGPGVQVTVVAHAKPLTMSELNDLRNKLKELTDKKSAVFQNSKNRGGQDRSPVSSNPSWTAEDEKTLAEIRTKLATSIKRAANPAIAETVTLQVTMAADAALGQREIRLESPLGLTNPLIFCVGQLPEFSKQATPVSQNLPKNFKESRFGAPPKNNPAQAETNITLPAIVNGQIAPGGVDRYRFHARKGQHLVVAASAQELIPYISDAVPGWFQATLALYDAKGHELEYADHYRFHPDPVLYHEIPEEGEYVVEIRDSIYRGREDFVYRITLGELPFVTSIFPLGGPAGAQTTVEMRGWNLPVVSLMQDAKNKGPGVYPLFLRQGQWISNRVPFAVDTLPECLEKEPNNRPENAQPVTLPIIVNGRIDQPGDWDVFRFEGRAGDQVVAEVYARRLGSPLDSVLKLTDATGRQLAFNDDHEDPGEGLITHHADSWLSATLPTSGTYYLHLGDVQHKGGPEYGYRLRISPPRPDFDLRVVPSSINARGGGTVPITVHALRKDGFSGEVAIALQGAPEGFVLSGGWVPARQDRVRLTLTVPSAASKEPFSLRLEGRAMIQGREVRHPAVPAEDMMQAFAYRHLVPAKELKVALVGRPMPKATVKILGETPVRIPAGGTARVRVSMSARVPAGQIQFELSEPPEGIVIKSVALSREGMEILLQSDAALVKPGLKGNLIVTASLIKTVDTDKGKTQGNQRRIPLATLPAIPFQVVSP